MKLIAWIGRFFQRKPPDNFISVRIVLNRRDTTISKTGSTATFTTHSLVGARVLEFELRAAADSLRRVSEEKLTRWEEENL